MTAVIPCGGARGRYTVMVGISFSVVPCAPGAGPDQSGIVCVSWIIPCGDCATSAAAPVIIATSNLMFAAFMFAADDINAGQQRRAALDSFNMSFTMRFCSESLSR